MEEERIRYIEKRLKGKAFKSCPKFTDIDEDYIASIMRMIAHGTIAKKDAQNIKKEMEKTLEPLEILSILRRHIRFVDNR